MTPQMGPIVQFGTPLPNGLVIAVAKSADFAGSSTDWFQYDLPAPAGFVVAFPTIAVGPKHLYVTYSLINQFSGYVGFLHDVECLFIGAVNCGYAFWYISFQRIRTYCPL